MPCEKFEARLHHLLDLRQHPETDDQLVAHAAICEDCRQILSAQRALFDAIEVFEPPPIPADFTEGVLARMKAAPASRPNYRAGRLLAALAVAAAVLVAVVPLARRAFHRSSPGDGPTVATSTDGESGKSPNATDSDPPEDALVSVPDMAAAGEQISADQFEAVFKTVRQVARQLPARAAAGDDSSGTATGSLAAHVAVGFRPVAHSVADAWNVVRRNLPMRKQDSPQKPQAAVPAASFTEPVA